MDIEALEREEIRKKQRTVAGLFVLAIVLAMVFAYWMGAFGFGATHTVYVDYNFAGGLDRGSTVRLAGIKVGRVADIQFVKQDASVIKDASTSLKLKIEISRDAFKQISSNSQFFINLAGLIGERYVEIVPGEGEPVKDGCVFRGVDPPRVDQLLSQGFGIFGDLRSFFSENKGDLKEIFATLNELSKNLSQILRSVSPEQRKQINVLLSNLSAMSEDLKTVAASLGSGIKHVENNGGRETWDSLHTLLVKANKIGVNDVRKLMLEDGVKVNFSSKKNNDRISEETQK